MSLLVDRRTAAPGGPQTHALVIGVSAYTQLPKDETEASPTDRETFGLRQARTPATSALRFARWLEQSYDNPEAPLGTVRLLLSPSEPELQAVPDLAAAAPTIERATRDRVEVALNEWYSACNERPDGVAILYVSGHGIQYSKDDGGIVLLEDFATLPFGVLNHSLDVGQVRSAMAGPTMAQVQFYFVDCCRIRPDAFAHYETLGDPIGLSIRFEGKRRSSAMFFAAQASTSALGAPGQGTLFSQALLDCLGGSGASHRPRAVGGARRWVVTAMSLGPALKQRVGALAAQFQEEQETSFGGEPIDDVVLHALAGPPEVPLTIVTRPTEAAPLGSATATPWGHADKRVLDGVPLTAPAAWPLPAGQYEVSVTMRPPFHDPPPELVVVLPPAAELEVLCE